MLNGVIMNPATKTTVRPDAKGRVTLGDLAKGVSSFTVIQGENHQIILEPFVEIPASEKWLYTNKEALEKVKKGLQDAASGKTKTLGSFSKYKDE